MEKLYESFKGTVIIHSSYTGIVCGYTDSHYILAVETKETKFGFRALKRDFFVEEEFKDPKYRYILEDERTIEKQKKLWLENQNKQTEQ